MAERLFCTFRVNGRLFGVNILDVKEVSAETTTTRVAHTPLEVLGLVNIRGHIYLALHPRRLLGMPATAVTAESRLVLFKPSVGNAFGVVVDLVAEIESVDPDRIERFNPGDHEPAKVVAGRVNLIDAICQLADELLVVLNSRRFLAVVEQGVAVGF